MGEDVGPWGCVVGVVGKGPLSGCAGRGPFGSSEPDSSVFGVAVDLESSLVDDDVVVVPAEGDQILGVGGPALRPGDDVMGLEPVSAVAAVGGAPVAVAVEDHPA